MSDNAHIRDFLKYYCGLQKEPQYAVLLSGLWGSGKTWFVKDFIANHLPQPERVLYVSLYGMQSFDDIESELFRLLHPTLASKPVKIMYRLARGILKTSINFDLDGDGKSDGSVSGGVPTEKILERISLDSNKILVLDDLERCSIPVADILGYVNQFIEHGGIKAILIANEEELRKLDAKTESAYARTKEKLIGRTFEVVPEITSALESFAADLPTVRVQEVVRANFALISQVYECSKYNNLRLVRHALWEFARLTAYLDRVALNSNPLLADLLALFLSYSFEVHSGTVRASEISKLHDSWSLYFKKNNNQPDPDQHIHAARSKYSGLNLYTSLVTDPVWVAIFSTGSIPQSELNQSLLKSKYFQNETQPNWVKLWHGTNLFDDEFALVLAEVESDWDARLYRVLGEVVHVTGLLLRYAKHGICGRGVEDVMKSAREYVDHLFASGCVSITQPNSRPSLFEMESYAGLGYASLEEEQFKSFLVYIDEQRQVALNASLPQQASDLLELLGTDTNLFCRRIVLNNDSGNLYYKTPILCLIDSSVFVEKLLRATPDERRTVAYALKERYSIQQLNDELLPELDWLRAVVELLENEMKKRAGKVSYLSISWLINPYMMDAIKKLEQAKPELAA